MYHIREWTLDGIRGTGRKVITTKQYIYILPQGAKHYNSTMQLRSRMSIIFFLISTNLEKLQPLNHEQNEKHLTRPIYFIVILMMMILFYFLAPLFRMKWFTVLAEQLPELFSQRVVFIFLTFYFLSGIDLIEYAFFP